MKIPVLLLLSFMALACTVSIASVREPKNAVDYWQSLSAKESGYSALAAEIDRGKLDPAKHEQARQLARIYRQEGKQEEAAKIFRLLWTEHVSPDQFVSDGRELGAIYLDMSAFSSSIESYQKILDYDRGRLQAGDRNIALDLNNLGICYLTAGSCSVNKEYASRYYQLAGRCFAEAQGIEKTSMNSALPGRSPAQINRAVLSEMQAEL